MKRLGTDSGEYSILSNAARATRHIDGISIEVGLREGGGTQFMIDEITDRTLGNKVHIAIDPYGSLPYEWKQDTISGWVYDNRMRNEALAALFEMTMKTNVNFIFFNLTDAQYFRMFEDGVPIFEDGRETLLTTYSIAHLDAVHSYEAITAQIDFFAPRMITGSIIVIDDITDFYNTAAVEAYIEVHGFTVFEKGVKKGAWIKK